MTQGRRAACAAIACDSAIGERYGFKRAALAETLAAAIEAEAGSSSLPSGTGRWPASPGWIRGGLSPPHRTCGSSRWTNPSAARESARRCWRSSSPARPRWAATGAFSSPTSTTDAQAFYERHGYRKAGALPDFARPGHHRDPHGEEDDPSGERPAGRPGRMSPIAGARRAYHSTLHRGRSFAGQCFAWSAEVASSTRRPGATACDRDGAGPGELIHPLRPRLGLQALHHHAILRLVSLRRLSLGSTRSRRLLRPSGTSSASPRFQALSAPPRLFARLERALGNLDVASLLTHSSGILAWYPFYTRRGHSFEEVLADVLEAHPPSRQSDLLRPQLHDSRADHRAGHEPPARGGHGQPRAGTPGASPHDVRLARRGGRRLGPAVAAATEFGNRIERRWSRTSASASTGGATNPHPSAASRTTATATTTSAARLDTRASSLTRAISAGSGGFTAREAEWRASRWLAPGCQKKRCATTAADGVWAFRAETAIPAEAAGHTGFTGTWLYVNAAADLVIALLTNRLHVPEPRDISAYRREMVLELLGSV